MAEDLSSEAAAGGGAAALKPAKRTAAMSFDPQARYPELVPGIKSVVSKEWQPVPGTLVESENEMVFIMTTPRDRWLRFKPLCFFLQYLCSYKNPDYTSEAADGADPVRANYRRVHTKALNRLPAAYVDPDLGMYSTTFARADVLMDGTMVTGRGNVPLGLMQAFYQKITRSYLTRSERAEICGTRERIRRSTDIDYANNTMSNAQKDSAAPLEFNQAFPAEGVLALTAFASADGIWPFSRRDPNLNKTHGRQGQASGSLIPPGTTIEARFTRHTPQWSYIQMDAAHLTDEVALSNTAATVGTRTNQGNAASEIEIKLKKFAILYELLELETPLNKRTLKFYHDVASVSTYQLAANVDTAFLNVPIERGARYIYIVPCYAHQLRYNPTQRKNQVMRFPTLDNLASIKLVIGDTPIYSDTPVDGLHDGKPVTPASVHMYNYLAERKLFDEPFHKFRCTRINNEKNYIGGILPVDMTTYPDGTLPAELKMTFQFSGATSPANVQVAVVSVFEALWRCELGPEGGASARQWTWEIVGGKGRRNKKAKF
jgi:hypothetical protein